MDNKPTILTDDEMRRVMVVQPVYSDDEESGHMLRMGRAVEAATRAEADKWRARFEWLAEQHWVEPEATFRLELQETEFSEQYKAALVAAVDAKLTPNAEVTGRRRLAGDCPS